MKQSETYISGNSTDRQVEKMRLHQRIGRLVCLAFMSSAVVVPQCVDAQSTFAQRYKEITETLIYDTEIQLTTGSGDNNPLWLNANKYGLSSVSPNNGYFLKGVGRPLEADSARNWGVGFYVDLGAAYNFTSGFFVQELYADFRFKKVVLSLGSKNRPMELKNNELSSGSQTFGINARPVPQVRLELPEYWNIPGTKQWLGLKAHISYGRYTDGGWEKHHAASTQRYAKNILLHTKAGYLRLGNEARFPLLLEAGLEMATQFGGTIYNTTQGTIKGGTGIKDYWKALIPGGKDATDGDYANAEGNWVGSWLASASWKFPTWKIRAYWDHYFEDHSALFFLDRNGYQTGDATDATSKSGKFTGYKMKDGLYGLEITLPRNRAVSSFVYEYLYTKYQSGAIYHDHNSAVSDHLGGIDNYYNNFIYTGWQHWGQAMGNPLYRSPIYNTDGSMTFKNNRFLAHHFGISGDPLSVLHYRLLLTYQEGWGTYHTPFDNKEYNTSFLAEITYAPLHIGKLKLKGWSIKGAFGLDHGQILGNNTGCQFTLRKVGGFRLPKFLRR
jgi:hypothetical protein